MTSPTASTCARDTSIRATTPHEAYPIICTVCLGPLATTPPTAIAKYDPVPEPAAKIIKCGHVFGRSCLERWMQESNTCPVCRVEFFVMPEPAVEEVSGEYGVPYFALGVYAGSGVVEHFSGLLISSRDETDERDGGEREEGVGHEYTDELGRRRL